LNKANPALNEKDAPSAIAAIRQGFERSGYICNNGIATSIFLAERLQKPLLVEGPPGVGKTELAKATAELLGKPLIRLQCYEGLDEAKALYEWKYGKQLLYTQVLKEKLGDLMAGAKGLKESIARLHEFDDTFFNEEFLEPRPLLKALWQPGGAVLLIDELDNRTTNSRPSCSNFFPITRSRSRNSVRSGHGRRPSSSSPRTIRARSAMR